MAAALLMLALFFIIGILTLLINAVIAPDWLDWVQFACFTMLFPLGLHCNAAIPITLFWIFTADFRAAESGSLERAAAALRLPGT